MSESHAQRFAGTQQLFNGARSVPGQGDPALESIPEVDGGSDDDGEDKADAGSHEALIERLKTALGDRVRDVRVSRRLTHSPACLVVDEQDMSGHLERLLKAAGQSITGARPILEVNPEHRMLQCFADEVDEDRAREWAVIFYEQALLSEGGRLEDPAGFVRRMNDMFSAMSAPG